MIYLVTRFFRRPATVNPTKNDTLPINPTIPNAAYTPGNLYMSGDLLVRIFLSSFSYLKTNFCLGYVYIY
jgi:hypothetical protein